MKTIQSLAILTLITSAMSVTAPKIAQADHHMKTSRLVISQDQFIPAEKPAAEEPVNAVTTVSETNAPMPITSEPAENTVTATETKVEIKHVIVDRPPVELTPMPKSTEARTAKTAKVSIDDNTAQSFRARRGEKLQDVLGRWSVRSGAKIEWSIADNSLLSKSYTHFGSFGQAVEALLTREHKPHTYIIEHSAEKKTLNSEATTREATQDAKRTHTQEQVQVQVQTDSSSEDVTIETKSAAPSKASPVAAYNDAQKVTRIVAMPPKHETPKHSPAPSTNAHHQHIGAPHESPAAALPVSAYEHEAFRTRLWRAYKGASIYEIAQVWSDEADVELIWHAPRNMALKETISTRMPFAQVMDELLSQYKMPPHNLKGILSISKDNNPPRLIVIQQ